MDEGFSKGKTEKNKPPPVVLVMEAVTREESGFT